MSPQSPSRIGMVVHSKLTLTGMDRVKGEAALAWRTAFDAAETKARIAELAKANLNAKQIQNMAVARVDTGSALIGVKDGWARRVNHTTRVEVAEPGEALKVREDTITIEIRRGGS
jgi:hypothetical protein